MEMEWRRGLLLPSDYSTPIPNPNLTLTLTSLYVIEIYPVRSSRTTPLIGIIICPPEALYRHILQSPIIMKQ